MKVLFDYVLLREDKKKRDEGIILSDVSNLKSAEGIVEEAGVDCQVKRGDKVLFNAFAIKEVEYKNGKCFIIKEKDIFAIL